MGQARIKGTKIYPNANLIPALQGTQADNENRGYHRTKEPFSCTTDVESYIDNRYSCCATFGTSNAMQGNPFRSTFLSVEVYEH